MIITAAITEGALVLFWMYLWLVSTIIASYLSERKGYGDRPGLATGLILSIVGTVIWLIIPAKAESKWKTLGPVGRGQKKRAARSS